MAHYAVINSDNVVYQVIVGKDETDGSEDWEQVYTEFWSQYGNYFCKRTSYNTYGNAHSGGGTPFRGNYAAIGSTWRPDLNPPDGAFVHPQPYLSWVLNETTLLWEPPIPRPENPEAEYGTGVMWDELTRGWVAARKEPQLPN